VEMRLLLVQTIDCKKELAERHGGSRHCILEREEQIHVAVSCNADADEWPDCAIATNISGPVHGSISHDRDVKVYRTSVHTGNPLKANALLLDVLRSMPT